jgi:HemY protein
MKALLILLITLSIAAWVGLGLHHDPGMLVITVAQWRIDMPLWLAVLFAAIGVIILGYVFKLFKGVFNLSSHFSNMIHNRQIKKSKKFTNLGLVALEEGNWAHAERDLLKGVDHNDTPWMNYLLAAKAAQKQQNLEKRDLYLNRAHTLLPEGEVAVGLARAKLQYQQRQYDQSLATLQALEHKSPHHPAVMQMMQKNYIKNKNWQAAMSLIPQLRHNALISAQDLDAIELKIYKGILLEHSKSDITSIAKIWDKIPKSFRTHPEIALIYAKLMQKKHAPKEAEDCIRHALKRTWSEDLVARYGMLHHPQPEKLLEQAESWLDDHPDSPALLLTLGRLCEQQQLWGKAQRYYEASLALKPSAQTYCALGLLLESMNELKAGAHYFKKGLMLHV